MRRYSIVIFLAFAMVVMSIPMAAASSSQSASVPAGTRLLIRLNQTISSKASRIDDRFTARVIYPRLYQGAVVSGHVSHLEKSGRLDGKTELGLEVDSIRLRNGQKVWLDAELLEIRQNESVKVVDEEGVIHSGSRGKQAIKRTGIGAAISGVLGGLIGGRKGVAIGLLIGAGAGAASLVVDGSKELKLEPGTEILIRVLRTSRRDSE